MPTYAGMSGEKLLVFLLGLAAELLELGEYGGNIEVAAAGLVFGFGSGRGDFRFLARGGFRAGFSLLARLTSKSRSVCLASPSVTGSIGASAAAFQWVRSRIAAIVDLVVPTSRMIALSLSSG